VALLTNNAERLERFYTDILEFKRLRKEVICKETADNVFQLEDEVIFIKYNQCNAKTIIYNNAHNHAYIINE